jgi:hypothetical protein
VTHSARPKRDLPAAVVLHIHTPGKTTLLRYLLEHSKEKVACIVNDVASINIDAKLVRNDRNRAHRDREAVNTTSDLADTIELANGCACELGGGCVSTQEGAGVGGESSKGARDSTASAHERQAGAHP